ncbi:F-box family protein with DUF295 [Prunus dulcis]|uniref:F-box family protein with DUF295 n=1 Tax=Prunus dulcis TaxID=3755 RepID=A0A4Y1RCN5_PRUDU|nr:F-box family protein with DUF295 [Prunus dulcis]
MSTRNPTELQRRPSKGRSSLDHLVGPILRTSSLIIVQSVHLTLPHEFRDARTTWCPETCQDCGSADSVSPRPARIADQADYGPLHPARATRADLVSSRNLPAGQADHSPLISPVCGSGIDTFIFVQLCKNIIFVHSHFQPVFRPQAIEVRGIHHRAILSFHVSNQVENFGISQNTGETLPNFRQKSKEILKRY